MHPFYFNTVLHVLYIGSFRPEIRYLYLYLSLYILCHACNMLTIVNNNRLI